jgi:hypothetical protein
MRLKLKCDVLLSSFSFKFNLRRYMKDCNIFDKKFTSTSADIIFSKAKAKGERKIGIHDFCKALALVAQDKGCGQGLTLVHFSAQRGNILWDTLAA